MRKGRNLYKRKDGRWEARVSIGCGANGCPRYKYLYGATYQAALEKMKDYEKKAVFPGQTPKSQGTLPIRDIAALWLVSSRSGWKLSTYVKYQDCLNKNILPCWGLKNFQEITQHDYRQLMLQLNDSLTASSLNTVNTVLSGLVKFSLANRYLEQNPFHLAFAPSAKGKKNIEILSPSEARTLTRYACLHLSPLTLGVLLALYGGLRLGEVCALQWKDVDLEENVLHIRKTLQRIKNPSQSADAPKTILHLSLPKNDRERAVPIHPSLLEFLADRRGDGHGDTYILRDLRPMEPRIYSYHFKKILGQAGVRDVNFHILRHTFASSCVEAGMDIKALSEILGHSSVKITMDRYVHLSMQFKQSQIGILNLPILKE